MGWFDWFLRAAPPVLPPAILEPKSSPEFEAFLRAWEGCSLTPYRDAVGLWTIGVGHLMTPEMEQRAYTSEEVEQLLADDITYFERRINDLVEPDLTQAQYDALCSLAFNIGSQALAQSTLLQLVNSGQFKAAGEQFPRWNKGRDKQKRLVEIEGLTKRRAAERNIWLFADYRGRP